MDIVISGIKREDQEQICLAWMSLFPILYTPVIYVANFVLKRYSSGLAAGIRYLLFLCLGLCMIRSLHRLIKNFSVWKLLLIFWFVLQYGIQIVTHFTGDEYYLGLMGRTILCLGYFTVASTVTDIKIFYRVIRQAAYLILGCVLIYLLGDGVKGYKAYSGVSYGQALSYCYVISAVVFTMEAVRKPDMKNLILMVVSIVVAFLLGTRGVLVCVAVAGILSMMVFSRLSGEEGRNKRKLLLFSLVVLGLTFFLVFFEDILNILLTLGSGTGSNTRIMKKLLSSSIGQSDGRIQLSETAIRLVSQRFFTGYGVASERLALQNVLNEQSPIYSHNLFLELCLQYGAPLGCLLFAWFIRKMYIGFQKCRDNVNEISCFITLFSIGLIPLFMSSSYLHWSQLYIFAGFLYGILMKGNTVEKHEILSADSVRCRKCCL